MEIRDAGEAAFIACEMEKRAIRLYERALALFADGPCQEAIRAILSDERNHLYQFSQMGESAAGFERAQMLSAQAGRVLFPGGLVEAQRKGAFDSVQALYAYAAKEEHDAVQAYTRFSESLSGSASAAFAAIALEEQRHLHKLNSLLSPNPTQN